MQKLLITAALIATAITMVNAAFCHENGDKTGPMNMNPINRDPPVFVKRVKTAHGSAELYTVGTGTDEEISLVHLYGNSGYEWGYAHGTLMKEPMLKVIDGFYSYLMNELIQAVNQTTHKDHIFLPDWFIKAVGNFGIEVALDMQNLWAEPFMDKSWYDEIKGMSDATGYSYDKIVRLFAIPEITRGRCSFYGMFGDATLGGKMLQLRALDWDLGPNLQQSPQITVYHPGVGTSKTLGNPWVNVGWTGVIFSLTGVSSNQFGISEIGVSYPQAPPGTPPFGDETSIGLPFVWLERKLVQFANNLDDGVQMIKDTNRTCHLILGMADARLNKATAIQYSHSIVNFYNWSDLQPLTDWHPRMKDVVYEFMDWSCPFYQRVGSKQIQAMYGKITPELSIMNITAPVMTGDLHVNVMDHTEQVLYTANAAAAGEKGPIPGYARQWVAVDLKPLYNKPYGQN